MPGFNSDKNELGDYKDGGTQAAWEGYLFSEEWNKQGRYQKTSLPECPEPLDGWCDCGKCKAMQLHKTKIFMSASFAINKPNRFFLLTTIQMTGFLKQVEVALGENTFIILIPNFLCNL